MILDVTLVSIYDTRCNTSKKQIAKYRTIYVYIGTLSLTVNAAHSKFDLLCLLTTCTFVDVTLVPNSSTQINLVSEK